MPRQEIIPQITSELPQRHITPQPEIPTTRPNAQPILPLPPLPSLAHNIPKRQIISRKRQPNSFALSRLDLDVGEPPQDRRRFASGGREVHVDLGYLDPCDGAGVSELELDGDGWTVEPGGRRVSDRTRK